MNGPHTAPATSAPPAPARPARAPRPAAPKPEPTAGGVMVFTYLRLHWLMILFCGTFLGAGLAYAAWELLPSKYESYAMLQVASTPSSMVDQGDPNRGKTAFVTYLKTQAQLIKSEFVLNSALNDTKYRIADLPTLKDQKDPIKYLDEKLVVSSSEGSEIIRISLEGDRPEDIRKIVDAVKDAYLREVVEKETNTKSALKVAVEQQRQRLEELVKRKAGPADTPQAGKPNPLPPGIGPPGGIVDPMVQPAAATAPAAPGALAAVTESDWFKRALFTMTLNRAVQLRDQLEQLPAAKKKKQTEIDACNQRINALKTMPLTQDVLDAAEKDPEVHAKLAEAARKRRDYEFKQRSLNDPTAPTVVRLKTEAEKAEQEAEQLKRKKMIQFEGPHRRAEAEKLTDQLNRLQMELKGLEEDEKVVRKRLADAEEQLAKTPPPPERPVEPKGPKIDVAETDLGAWNGMYASLTRQLIALDLELQTPPRVSKRQDASTPMQKDTKKQIIGTVVAGLAGFGLIALGVVGYESRVRKVSSLTELKATGPTPVVGVIPWQPDGSTARDPVKRADVNESVDKLRAYVAQTWLAKGATTIAVTSPLGDEGKSFTAFGLASSLAQAGYRALLVDFDLRHPSLHAFAGVGNETGVCELLRGESDPRSAVVVLPNGLYFLPAGKWSDEARQAAVGGRLEQLLNRLKEPFDCVVLHGHALLTVAESVEIARRSEVVLLCTLYRETRLPLLKRAVDRVAAMEVPYSGVVYLGATPNEALC